MRCCHEGRMISLCSLTTWFMPFRIICASLLANVLIYNKWAKTRNPKALSISCIVENKSINEKWKCCCTKSKKENKWPLKFRNKINAWRKIFLLYKLVLHVVRFNRNLNLKKNGDLEVCFKVVSNLHKQIYSQFNYTVVRTNMKPTFLPV